MHNLFFVKVTNDYWTAKNKLQTEVKEFARACERMILQPNEVEEWLKYFQSGVSKINKAHKRCKPLQLQIEKKRQPVNGDIHVYIYGVTHLTIYAGKEVSDAKN